jgi:hypothetical protein
MQFQESAEEASMLLEDAGMPHKHVLWRLGHPFDAEQFQARTSGRVSCGVGGSVSLNVSACGGLERVSGERRIHLRYLSFVSCQSCPVAVI